MEAITKKTIQAWELQRSLREQGFRNQKLCWGFGLFIGGRCRSMRWHKLQTQNIFFFFVLQKLALSRKAQSFRFGM